MTILEKLESTVADLSACLRARDPDLAAAIDDAGDLSPLEELDEEAPADVRALAAALLAVEDAASELDAEGALEEEAGESVSEEAVEAATVATEAPEETGGA